MCPVPSCDGASCPMLRVLPQCCNNTPQCCLKYSWPGRPNGSESLIWISYYRPPLPAPLLPLVTVPRIRHPTHLSVPGSIALELKVPPSLFSLVWDQLIAIVCDCLAVNVVLWLESWLVFRVAKKAVNPTVHLLYRGWEISHQK